MEDLTMCKEVTYEKFQRRKIINKHPKKWLPLPMMEWCLKEFPTEML